MNQQTAHIGGGTGGTLVGGFMEKMLLATDAILNPAPIRKELAAAPSEVVDAEVVD